jgi:SAM-dependent methyltransferase
MSVKWLDVSNLSFNSLLLLEKVQLSWFPGWLPETELGVALRANPHVAWYMRHKCPNLEHWLDKVLRAQGDQPLPAQAELRRAEEAVMRSINDLLVYVVDPSLYDAQPFLGWDDRELSGLVDFSAKTVIDVGSGTGRLAFIAAPKAAAVYAVEPVGSLRDYIKVKARRQGLNNVFAVDGLITEIPFAAGFADVTMGGHVFGDDPAAEYQELKRVTTPGGMVILCPGNNDRGDEVHQYLLAQGFDWGRFAEPEDGMKRKYWQTVA